nr:MAG: replication associated protein [Cressdnaviricota sp.]
MATNQRSMYWVFTLNNPEDYDAPRSWPDVRYAIWQSEVSDSGTEHLQGYVVFSQDKRQAQLKKLNNKVHWETRNGTHDEASNYCTHEGTAKSGPKNWVCGPWVLGSEEGIPKKKAQRNDLLLMQADVHAGMSIEDISRKYLGTFLRYRTGIMEYMRMHAPPINLVPNTFSLKLWQQTARQELLNQNNRKVLWYWDTTGGAGKSTLAKYLEEKDGAFLCRSAKLADIAMAYNSQPLVVIDLTRSYENNYAMYNIIECFKDGYIFSSKYESRMKKFTPAKVIVFANFAPDRAALSEDRWDIHQIQRQVMSNSNKLFL